MTGSQPEQCSRLGPVDQPRTVAFTEQFHAMAAVTKDDHYFNNGKQ